MSFARLQSGVFFDQNEARSHDFLHAAQHAPWMAPPSQRYLPLLEVKMTTEVVMFTSRTCLTQTFKNNSMNQVREANYAFPLYENSAVVSFTCTIEGRAWRLKGIVRPKSDARHDYNEALSRMQPAGLLEEHTPDVFMTTLGNIPANSTIKIEIVYVGELKHDLQYDVVKLRIPTSIAPRYGRPPDHFPDAASVQMANGLTIEVNVVTTHTIRSIESHSHSITYGLDNTHTSWASFLDATKSHMGPRDRGMMATVRLSQTIASFDRDFVLEIYMEHESLSKSQALAETHGRYLHHKAFMLTLSSGFAVSSTLTNRYPEIIFVADRSGSMTGKMATLKSSLRVFLHSIPENCRFNIWSFGSSTEFLWEGSRPYSSENLERALEYVNMFEADMGGTELLLALQRVVQPRRNGTDLTTEVIVLTDGQVWNLNEIIEFVGVKRQETRGKVRFFAMGVGDSVSHALVEGIAKAGGGYAEVVSVHGQGGWDHRLVAMLKAALREALGSFNITFIRDGEEIGEQYFAAVPGDHVYSQRPRFLQSPIDIPMINPYGRRTVFMLFESASPLSFANIVRVKATTQTGKELFSEDIPVTPVSRASTTIHVLAAKALMKDLENGRSWIHSSSYRERQTPEELDNMVRSEAQRLGCKYFLTGRWTSFVAIEFDAEAEREDYKMGEDLGLLQERRTANPDHSDSDSDSETDGPRDNSNGRGSHGGPPRRPPRGPPGGASGSSSGRFINSNSGRFGSRGPSGGNSSEAASKGGSLGNSTGRSTGNSLAIGSTNSYSKGVIHPFDQATPSLESEPSRVARIGPFDRSKSEAKSELNIDTLTSCLASPLPISMDRKKTLDNDPEDFSIFSAKTSKFSGLTDKTSKQKKRENASLDKLPRVGLLSRLKRKVKINSNSDTSTSQLASPLPIPMDRKSEPRSLLDTKSEPRSLLDTKSEPRSSLGTKMVPPIRLDRGREIDPYPDGIPSTLARTSGLSSTDPISKIREQGAAHRFSKNKLKSYNAGSGISYRTTTKTSDLVVEDWDKSPEKMAQEDIARCLISLQNYDGSFPEISDLLGDIYRTSKVGIDKEAWKYANNEWASGSAVPTIIAIAYFEEACRLCKELWELVVRKAMDYVTRAISDGTTRANLIRLTRSHIRSVLDVDALSSYLRHTQATKDNPSLANANDHREASQGTEPLPTSLSNMQKATGKASSPEDVLISSPTKAFDGLSEDQAHINSNFPVF